MTYTALTTNYIVIRVWITTVLRGIKRGKLQEKIGLYRSCKNGGETAKDLYNGKFEKFGGKILYSHKNGIQMN